MFKYSKPLLIALILFTDSTIKLSYSSALKEEPPANRPAPSQPFALNEERYRLFEQHIFIEFSNFPDFYHRALTFSFKDSFKKQYQMIADLDQRAETVEKIQNQQAELLTLKSIIDTNQHLIEKQEKLLKSYNIAFDQEDQLRSNLKQSLERQTQIISSLENGPPELSADKKQKLMIARNIVEEAQQGLDILTLPLQQRKVEQSILKNKFNNLEEDLKGTEQEEIEELQELQREHRRLINSLARMRAQPLYKEVEFVNEIGFNNQSRGHWLNNNFAQILLGQLIGPDPLNQALYRSINCEHLWLYCLQNLELPDIQLVGITDSNLHTAYQNHVSALVQKFKQRCQEDAFCLETLCSINFKNRYSSSFMRSSEPIKLDSSVFTERQKVILAYLGTQDDILKTLPQQDVQKTEDQLEQFLESYQINLDDHYLIALIDTPFSLIGHYLSSLERGNFYSWQSDLSLLIKAQDKLRRQQDISEEIMLSFYRLLARDFNRRVFEQISSNIKPKPQPLVKTPSPPKKKSFIPLITPSDHSL